MLFTPSSPETEPVSNKGKEGQACMEEDGNPPRKREETTPRRLKLKEKRESGESQPRTTHAGDQTLQWSPDRVYPYLRKPSSAGNPEA